jgi:hypothetical protein
MSGSADRRPWLILSRAEALALQRAALESLETYRGSRPTVPASLARALRMIDNQIRWIDGYSDGEAADVHAALLRETFSR